MSPVNGTSRSPFNRVGLSEYTSQRLAELKARRAEADEEMKASYKIRAGDGSPFSKQTTSDGPNKVDLQQREGGYSVPRQKEEKSETEHDDQQSADDKHSSSFGKSVFLSASSHVTKPFETATNDHNSNDTVDCKFPGSSTTGNHMSTFKSEPTQIRDEQEKISRHAELEANKDKTETAPSNSKSPNRNGIHKHTSFRSPLNKPKSVSSAAGDENVDDDGEYVGFASLPDQVHRKAVKKGFDFTLMVVGESGLGKSTLISCLFQSPSMYKDKVVASTQEMVEKTVTIEKKVLEIEEKGVKLRLTIIDTPGFNDALDNTESWKSICDYVDRQYDNYFSDENGLHRRSIVDTRVHCCLFFLSPLGRGIRQAEVALMRELQSRVNLVPVIAKADTLTLTEINKLKEKIVGDIRKDDIEMYELPECDEDEDEDFIRQDRELKAAIPFAVIGSNTIIEVGGKKIRGRMYPWGVVDVDNPQHCDFSKLRQFLIGTHMQDLKDVTQEVHYENYRARQLQEQFNVTQKDRNKLKRDSMQKFDKALETDYLLSQKEEEIQRMKKMLRVMENKLAMNMTNPQHAKS